MRLGRLRFESKYLTIQYFYEHKSWSIRWMCRKLGITRAAYYKWLHREVPAEELENQTLAQLIQEYDQQFGHILGRKRMCCWMNVLNHKHYNVKRVHRLMKELRIHSVIRRKRKKYLRSTPETTAENLLARDFYAEAPNLKWATDVTEFKWYQGNKVQKLYLSAILDLYDRSVVSWVVSTRNDNKLVLDTFRKAIQANNNERLQERFGDKAPAQIRDEALAAGSPEQYPIAPNKRIEKYKSRFAA